jgi:hypothetical protein
MWKKLLLIALLLGAIGAAVGYYMFNKKVPGLENIPADFTLTADELFDALAENESEATAKYADKVILVSGKVLSIAESDTTIAITLSAANADMGGINCSFRNKPSAQEWSTKEGDDTQVKGRFVGYDDLFGIVQLKDCVPARK